MNKQPNILQRSLRQPFIDDVPNKLRYTGFFPLLRLMTPVGIHCSQYRWYYQPPVHGQSEIGCRKHRSAGQYISPNIYLGI